MKNCVKTIQKALKTAATVSAETMNRIARKTAKAGKIIFYRAKNLKVRTAAAGLTAVFCITVTASVYAADCRRAVEVICNGHVFGYVSDAEHAHAVETDVKELVHGDISGLAVFEYSEKTVPSDSISDVWPVADSVLENTAGISKVCGLYVDGVLTAAAGNSDVMQSMLDELTAAFTFDGFEFCGYANKLVLRDIYITEDYLSHTLTEKEDFLDGKSGVQVMTARVEDYDEEIPYNTVVEKDQSRSKTYSRVAVEGENGTSHVTARVVYLNGIRSQIEVLRSETVSQPVDRVVIEGASSGGGYRLANSVVKEGAEMTFPCKITDSTYITSYWGDGRGHRGVDIASPEGTQIYAAMDGVVSFVGYKEDYGNYIVIDHYDGVTQTLYAHNSQNLVSVGETITAGQYIAKVGRTGNATGNHLHFSVLRNGEMVDPAPFIGLTR